MANIASLLKAQLATPERILYRQFIEGGWRDVSAREIAAYAGRLAGVLRAEGLAPGERIALCLKNGIHWSRPTRGALGLRPGHACRSTRTTTRKTSAWCL